MLLFGITLITLGAVIPGLKEKFQLDELSSGTLFSILPFGILTGSLLFGPMCDKYGYKWLLTVSFRSLCAGFEGIAFVSTTGLLKTAVFLFGLSGGAINGAVNALVADISGQDKSANLSLLGVFFAAGALGMPFVLGVLKGHLSFEEIVAFVGLVAFLAGMLVWLLRFPPPKHVQGQGSLARKSLGLLTDSLMLLISLFLFFQSSLEAIIHNWATTYLMNRLAASERGALYALSLNVAGMACARLLSGSLFRYTPVKKILVSSLILMLAGSALLQVSSSFAMAVAALVILGAGMAGGFPIMFALIAERYKDISATAFSFALVIALVGNMLLNYGMGLIAHSYGIRHLTTMVWVEVVSMILIGGVILKRMSGMQGRHAAQLR